MEADFSTHMVSQCVTRFHYLSHSRMVGSSFLTALQILSGFSLKLAICWENKPGNAIPCQINIVALSFICKKINNSVIFDSETSTKSFPGNDCPMNYQRFHEKYPSSNNLIKSYFQGQFLEQFGNFLELLSKMPMLKCFY